MVKNHTCNDCGTVFTRNANLSRHKIDRCNALKVARCKALKVAVAEESEPLVKVIKLSADAVPSAFSSHATSYDDQDDDEDRLLTESELEELWGRFKTLHQELIHERKRENITELNKILQIRLEEKMLNHIDYMKAINAINKDYLATYL